MTGISRNQRNDREFMQALSDNLKNNTNENFKRIHNGAKIINDGLKS